MENERKKNKRYCIAQGCINSDKKMPNLSFFSLPKEEERRRKWLITLGREDLFIIKDLKIKSYVVCSAHFDDSAVKTVRLLKNDAVPTMFLPNGITILNVRTIKNTKEIETQTDDTPIDTQIDDTKQKILKHKPCEELVNSESKRQRLDKEVDKMKKERKAQNDTGEYAESIARRINNLIEWQNKNRIKGNRLSKEFKMFALNLHYSSPHAYRCLQTTLKLPSEIMLNKIMLKRSGDLSGQVLGSLSLKLKSLPKKAKYCTLCVSKMALQKNLCYDIKTDEVIGFYKSTHTTHAPQFASNVYVVMLQGIYCNWKQPISYFLMANTENYEEFDLWLNDAIVKLFGIGIEVKAIVTKDNSCFEKFAKNIKKITSDKPYFFVGEHKVYYIFDVPCLLQSLRDRLLSTNFNYNGNIISWNYIQSLYEDQKEKNLKLIPKLSDTHVRPNNSRRKETNFAAQIFSNTVYAALETYIDFGKIPEEARATSKFVKTINDLFDVLNSSQSDSTRKPFKMTPQQRNTLEAAEIMFSNMTSIDSNNTKPNSGHNKTFLNFQITIQSIQQLFQDLRKEGYKYLFTRRLNQDSMDKFFGSIRQQCSSSTEPTPVQFTRAFSKLYIQNMLRSPPAASCKTDIHKILLKAEKLMNTATDDKADENKSLILLSGENDYRFDLPQTNTLVYVASYLVFKCYKIHTCSEMLKVLLLLKRFDESELYPHFKDFNKNAYFYGKLKLPPEVLIEYVEELEATFTNNFFRCIQDRPRCTIFGLMKEISQVILCRCFPIDYFIELFLRLRIFQTMKINNCSLPKVEIKLNNFVK